MKDVIKKLQVLLPCEKFIVTGSTALYYYGLVDKSGDLDIILCKPKEETIELLKRLQENYPAKTKPIEGYSSVSYIFMEGEVKVDIFIKQDIIPTELKIEDFYLSKIDRIIEEKKLYNRWKDWIQLRNLARCFFKQEEFEQYMNDGFRPIIKISKNERFECKRKI